ncbi:unnamed protein product [Musa acuminata subsp. malaccensis]|uniref:(wild Malaysian banana) hypothetical protein n=1 Tax=Musa acuminata subsp. malaccensis TaxID=214687 RepID=A0A804K5W5_MUSAM|nr:PREDICTED: GATA transcription factor 1-like [Musa acuminata subsp. malaccensis]CAG1831355.1 unnamed protein product [Musa acuminata subsp. malaccensis]
MVETLEEAAAAAAAGEACFADELLLLDFTSNAYHPSLAAATSVPAAGAGELQHQALLLHDFFEPSVDGLPGLPAEGEGGGEEEEEELEWLANKDAFPALETSFEIPMPSQSRSSSSSGAAAGAVGERPSPVSVLSAAASFSAPVRPRSKGRRRRRRVLAGLSPEPACITAARRATAVERRCCGHCRAEETPQWRAGPEGPKTLCNACGVRYKSGRLVPEYRPASSPTFSAAIHSNSHRRILELRRQKAARELRSNTRAPPPTLSLKQNPSPLANSFLH